MSTNRDLHKLRFRMELVVGCGLRIGDGKRTNLYSEKKEFLVGFGITCTVS